MTREEFYNFCIKRIQVDIEYRHELYDDITEEEVKKSIPLIEKMKLLIGDRSGPKGIIAKDVLDEEDFYDYLLNIVTSVIRNRRIDFYEETWDFNKSKFYTELGSNAIEYTISKIVRYCDLPLENTPVYTLFSLRGYREHLESFIISEEGNKRYRKNFGNDYISTDIGSREHKIRIINSIEDIHIQRMREKNIEEIL